MIVRPADFAFDLEKHRQLKQLATDQTLTEEQREIIDEHATAQPFVTEVKSFCFYCAEKLTVPAVAWRGCDGQHGGNTIEIWLHPNCAEQFFARLQRDVNELNIGKQKADEQFAVWKRDHPI